MIFNVYKGVNIMNDKKSKVFNIAIALNIFAFYMLAFTIIFAEYFGGLFQSFIVGTVIFGTCFLIVGFYIITDKE